MPHHMMALLMLMSCAASDGGASLWRARAEIAEPSVRAQVRGMCSVWEDGAVAASCAGASVCAETCFHVTRVGPLQLRGGRQKRDLAEWDEENEKLAREYLEKVREEGKAARNVRTEDSVARVGVPEQVAEEEADSKRRSMVRVGRCKCLPA